MRLDDAASRIKHKTELPNADDFRRRLGSPEIQKFMLVCALAITRQEEAARDVVQEVCMKTLHSNRDNHLDVEGSRIFCYLRRAIQHETISRYRKQRPTVSVGAGSGDGLDWDKLTAHSINGGQEDHVYLGEVSRAMRACMTPDKRHRLLLAATGPASDPETALKLGEREGTFKSRVYRVRQNLKRQLAEAANG